MNNNGRRININGEIDVFILSFFRTVLVALWVDLSMLQWHEMLSNDALKTATLKPFWEALIYTSCTFSTFTVFSTILTLGSEGSVPNPLLP